jgi:hypothetical protein
MRRLFGVVFAILMVVLVAVALACAFTGLDLEFDGEVSPVACLTCGAECLHSEAGASEVVAEVGAELSLAAAPAVVDYKAGLKNCIYINTDKETVRVLKLPRGMAVARSNDADTSAACSSGRFSGARA